MLTSGELARARADAVALLPDTCEISRVTLEPDGAGGFTESWNLVVTVACRLAPTGQLSQERLVAERVTNVSTWTLTVPAETDVRVGDRATIGTRTLEVAAVLARSDEISRRVIVTEVV
jgi:head-tail adaptor